MGCSAQIERDTARSATLIHEPPITERFGTETFSKAVNSTKRGYWPLEALKSGVIFQIGFSSQLH